MALRKHPYIPLYVQDFMTDEKLMECSAEATGVYIRLMCIMHKGDEYGTILLKQKDKQTNEQINNFAYKVAKYMPYPLEVVLSSLKELLEEKVIEINGDKLSQKRMVHDNKVSKARAVSGAKGGKKTQSFAKAKYKANKKQNSKQIPEDENESESENEIKNESKDLNTIEPEILSFDLFWDLYEKKVDRNKCEKKWKKLKLSEKEKIFETLPAYIKATPDKNYRKNPSTYLNNKSWENEIIERKSKTRSKMERIMEIPLK